MRLETVSRPRRRDRERNPDHMYTEHATEFIRLETLCVRCVLYPVLQVHDVKPESDADKGSAVKLEARVFLLEQRLFQTPANTSQPSG